jgi:glucosylceramidase
MKKFAALLTAIFACVAMIACNVETSTTSTTTATTTSATETTTTTETTETTTSTVSSWPETDYASISVQAFATNSTQRFADVSHLVSAWSPEWNDTTKITVDERETYQPFYGTGAALTLSAAKVIHESPYRDELIQYLFGKDGLAIRLVRLTVGASDFIPSDVPHYTYNDTANNAADLTLSGFSIEQDRIILDILKEALEINPDLVFIAAPWSAPAWMKDNKSLYMGSLKTEYQNVYAKYLVKYLQAMQAEGITIHYLSIQNEPRYASSNYPGMLWDRLLTTSFINDFLGPQIRDAGLPAKIMIWDHNVVDNGGYYEQLPFQVLRNATAKTFVKAIGVHCYSGTEEQIREYVQMLYDNDPTIEVFMTECTAITTYRNVESNIAWSVKRMYTEAYNRFAVGTTYWNMALDPSGTVHNGGCGNCTGLISVPITANPTYSHTVEADGYLTGHFNRTTTSGTVRILASSTNSYVRVVAFLNPDGTVSIVAHNEGAAKTVTVMWRASRFRINLYANSLTTISFDSTP